MIYIQKCKTLCQVLVVLDNKAAMSPVQEQVLEPVLKRIRAENQRYNSVLKQINSHHSAVLRQWKSLLHLLSGPRGAWANQ